MVNPVVWFEVVRKHGTEILEYILTVAYFTDPEGHLIGVAPGAVQ
jgi:hypothetical protein